MTVVCLCFAARNTAQVHSVEMKEQHELRFRRGIRADNVAARERGINEPNGERRKLDCMAAVHRREGKGDAATVTVRSNVALSQWEDTVSDLCS